MSFQVQSVTPKSQFFKLAQYYLNGPLENFSSAAFGGLLSKQGLNTAKSSCGTHPATELLLISGTHTGVLSRWGLGSGRSSLVPGLGDALGVFGNLKKLQKVAGLSLYSYTTTSTVQYLLHLQKQIVLSCFYRSIQSFSAKIISHLLNSTVVLNC